MKRVRLVLMSVLTFAGTLLAHHSFSMFDREHQITLTGIVTRFPLKSGKLGGMLERATLPDGRELGDGNPPNGKFDR